MHNTTDAKPKNRNNVLMFTAVFLIIAAGLSAWALVHTETPSERVSISIGYRPTVVVDLAFLKAVERGDFAKQGIDVTLKPYGKADQIFAALSAGEIQGSVGVPLEPILGMATKDQYLFKSYLIWYFDAQNPYDGFIVPQDSSINSVSDLSGKMVGSHPSRQVTYFVSNMLPNSVVQPYNPASPLLAMQSGDQDAAYVLEPALSQAVASGDYRLIESGSISKRIFNDERVPAAVSILSNSWIEQHPAEAERFVSVAQQQWQAEISNTDKTGNVLLLSKKEYGGYSEAVASRIVEPVSSLPEQLTQKELQQFIDVLQQGKLLDGAVDFERLLYAHSGAS